MGKDLSARQDPAVDLTGLFGALGAPYGEPQGGVGSSVSQVIGPAEGLSRAETGAMDPNPMSDLFAQLFGTPAGNLNASAGRPWKL